MAQERIKAPKYPTAFLAFGGTGDVAKKKLYPALYHLAAANLLPKDFYVLGVARRGVTDSQYRSIISKAVKTAIKDRPVSAAALRRLTECARFFSGDLTTRQVYDRIEDFVEKQEKRHHSPILRIFYLGLPPAVYPHVFSNVQTCRMGSALCSVRNVLSRIIIEKPFGYDVQSAEKLHNLLKLTFEERQIYRIDHYLGKEAVQNILTFRFGNAIFDELWHNREIRSIQITALETLGVEDRANYFESAGALRDVTQSHLLQMLAYATMDEPKNLTSAEIHRAKEAILKKVEPYKCPTTKHCYVRGQYTSGKLNGQPVAAYRREPKVNPRSQTETYAAIKLGINTPRWKGVPIYLRTGKRLARKVTEITFLFRHVKGKLMENEQVNLRSNFLTLRLDPDPGISVRLNVKKPGYGMDLVPADMHFCYAETFGNHHVGDYERLLLDVIEGNQMLFASSTEVKESWRIVQPVLSAFQSGKAPLYPYKPGSLGPKAAYDMLKEDGEHWVDDTVDICPRPRRSPEAPSP